MNKKMFLSCILCLVILKTVTKTKANTMLEKGVDKKEKQQILDVHNWFRLMLALGKVPNQPKATNMKRLCWDSHLAQEAQAIASTMINRHVRIHDDRWLHVGQNLAQIGSNAQNATKNWQRVITSWFNEVRNYTFGNKIVDGTGHYTQVAWANTSNIGCGYTHYIDNKKARQYREYFVCNYGPGGNILGMPPYQINKCGCEGLCNSDCMSNARTTTSRT